MEPSVGIDFGTTNSAMAWCDERGESHVLRNAEGEEKTPSAVYFGASEVVVGTPALKLVDNPEESGRVVLSCKRYLRSNAVWALPGRRVAMVDAAAAVLAKLKRDAEELHFHAPVRRAVVTCPAAFGELERERIEQAARQAGFAEVQLLEEPVAAALAYARQGVRVGQHVLVYDLGGGTFDLAVLLREGDNGFRLALEPRGLATCGGDDFDRALYDHLDERLRAAWSTPSAKEFNLNWFLRCRECKESLSHLSSSQFSAYVEGKLFKERVERSTFERLIHDRLEQTVRLTQELMAEAARRGHPVDTVVLIGGSARVPYVAARLAEVLPVQPHKWQQQDVAVALGAALWGAPTPASMTTGAMPVANQTSTPMVVGVKKDRHDDYHTREIDNIDSSYGYLELERLSDFMGFFAKFDVYIDNILVGKIKNGAKESFKISSGFHKVYISWSAKFNNFLNKNNSDSVTINVNPGQTIKMECFVPDSTFGKLRLWKVTT